MRWPYCRASGRSREKSQISRDFQGHSREFRGNFRGQFRWKTPIGKERPISWELPEQISLESDWFCADMRKVFNETIRSIIAFTQASYRNLKSYFTCKLIEHNKNKQKNQDIENIFTILVASSSIFFIQLHVVCLTFEFSVYDDSSFLNIWGTLLSIYCWRALARQLPILYNSEKKAKSVGCKIEDMRSRFCFFISGHSGVPVNARGNIDRFRAIVQLS